MKIGIVNAGNIGLTLAEKWVSKGHEIVAAKDGSQEKLDAFVAKHSGQTEKKSQAEVAADADVILFSVYWPKYEETLEALPDLSGKIIIDTMNPLNVNDKFEHYHDLEFMKSSSTSEDLQRRYPGAKVVKAFSTMPSEVLNIESWAHSTLPPSIFLAGNDKEAKASVRKLAEDAGFSSIDSGGVESARLIESMGVLLHHIGENEFGGDYGKLAPTFVRAE